jgi:hypothetical protein
VRGGVGIRATAKYIPLGIWRPPPCGVTKKLESWAAAVGDRRVSPLQPCQHLTGVPRPLLNGRPSAGGFGLLPLNLHTRAREAVWAARLALSAGRTAGTTYQRGPPPVGSRHGPLPTPAPPPAQRQLRAHGGCNLRRRTSSGYRAPAVRMTLSFPGTEASVPSVLLYLRRSARVCC